MELRLEPSSVAPPSPAAPAADAPAAGRRFDAAALFGTMDGVAGLLSSSSNFACDVRLVGSTAKSNDDTLFRTACASIVFAAAAAAAAAAVALDDVVVDWLGVLLPLPAAFVCCDDAAALLPTLDDAVGAVVMSPLRLAGDFSLALVVVSFDLPNPKNFIPKRCR